MTDRQEDLDAFLTLLESKLRGPFSSLDLAKTITTNQLRGPISKNEYLQNVGQVLNRAEKSTQLRLLIGLLGLDPSDETDDEIHSILTNAQTKSQHVEEWVRVISGLVHGIMFVGSVNEGKDDMSDAGDDHVNAAVPLRGEEANEILEKTCNEIIERVRRIERESMNETKDDDGDVDDSSSKVDSALAMSDVDPTFAPFRFSLLNKHILDKALPEVTYHNHFQINDEAEVLNMDSKLEAMKAQEEYEHSLQSMPQSAKDTSKNNKAASDGALPILPGMQRKSGTAPGLNKGVVNRPKTNMFIPTKKPAFTMPNPKLQKPGLKIRKAGAAQDLLKSKKSRLMMAGGVGAGAGGGGGVATGSGLGSHAGTGGSGLVGNAISRGRANRLMQNSSTGASRMKILDMNEVQGLEKEKVEKEQQQLMAGKVRKRSTLATVGQKRKAAVTMNNESNTNKLAKLANDNDSNHDDEDDDDNNKKSNQGRAHVDKNSFADIHDDDDGQNGNGLHADFGNSTNRNGHGGYANNGDNDQRFDDENQKPRATLGGAFAAAAHTDLTSPFADAGALATAALNAYQAQLGMQRPPLAAAAAAGGAVAASPPAHHTAAAPTPTPHHRQLDWRSWIKEKSNKLSSEDRFRIQQFFVDKYNPTPDQTTFKMKLHEERTSDPKTGEAVKATYYLELDYNTFTCKQSKKIKRYHDGN